MRRPVLSVVVPCYNEEKRIGATLDALFSYLPHHVATWEVIVVDDGSTDKTWDILSVYQRVFAHYVPIRVAHQGKGYAVKTGMLTAYGEFRLFMDADLSTPLTEIPAALEWLHTHDVAIGSREIDRSKVRATLKRRIMGRIFNTLIADLTPDVRDTQCGFKAFRATVARELFAHQKVKGWAFDVELLYLARVLGYNVKEFPVAWSHNEGSKVRMVSASFEMIRDVLDIPVLHRRINLPESIATSGDTISHRYK